MQSLADLFKRDKDSTKNQQGRSTHGPWLCGTAGNGLGLRSAAQRQQPPDPTRYKVMSNSRMRAAATAGAAPGTAVRQAALDSSNSAEMVAEGGGGAGLTDMSSQKKGDALKEEKYNSTVSGVGQEIQEAEEIEDDFADIFKAFDVAGKTNEEGLLEYEAARQINLSKDQRELLPEAIKLAKAEGYSDAEAEKLMTRVVATFAKEFAMLLTIAKEANMPRRQEIAEWEAKIGVLEKEVGDA